MIGSAEIGETLMRAFILRRVGLIEEGEKRRRGWFSARRHFRDCRAWPARCFLRRNGYPYQVLDAINDPDGRVVMERFGVLPKELPVMLCPNGTLLKRPSNEEAGACLGLIPDLDPNKI
jgi:thioredoxin reductase (NADPH)